MKPKHKHLPFTSVPPIGSPEFIRDLLEIHNAETASRKLAGATLPRPYYNDYNSQQTQCQNTSL